MKVFIGIESCYDHRGSEQAVRDSWLKDWNGAYKFFLCPNVRDPQPDELILDAEDGWFNLLRKFRAEIDWFMSQDFDYFFRCHNDTYVFVPRLLTSGFENLDWIGHEQHAPDWSAAEKFSGHVGAHRFAYGGSGFWFSRKACETLQKFLHTADYLKHAEHAIEDIAIGKILSGEGFVLYNDHRYHERQPGPLPENDIITLHESETDLHVEGKVNLRNREHMLATHRRAHGQQ